MTVDDAMVINIPSRLPGIRNMGLANQTRRPSNTVLLYKRRRSFAHNPRFKQTVMSPEVLVCHISAPVWSDKYLFERPRI